MFDVLADNPVLTLFLVVGLGSALGLVPFGPIRFGPAGALFVGLALGAMGRWRWPAATPWSSSATRWSWSGPRTRSPGRSTGWGRGLSSTWPMTAARSTTAGVLLSNPKLAGATVSELDIGGRFGGVVTRVRRGDLDLLARDDSTSCPATGSGWSSPGAGWARSPATRATPSAGSVRSTRSASASGSPSAFSSGCCRCRWARCACRSGSRPGPLVAGIVLGWLERTGPIVWSPPPGPA